MWGNIWCSVYVVQCLYGALCGALCGAVFIWCIIWCIVWCSVYVVHYVVQVVSKESMAEDACVREFFNQLVTHHLDEKYASRRLDLLACGNVAQGASGAAIVQQLESLLAVSPPANTTVVRVSSTVTSSVVRVPPLLESQINLTTIFCISYYKNIFSSLVNQINNLQNSAVFWCLHDFPRSLIVTVRLYLLQVPVGISKDFVGRDVVWQGQPNEENTKIT